MIQRYSLVLCIIVLLLATESCNPSWTSAIQYGKTLDKPFSETVNTEISKGLIIVPVQIAGNNYRFLFDTGAILSISKEVQQKMAYKEVSTGGLVDSDNNRQKVSYVQVDTLQIGKIPFIEQTAFVADFTKNPIIACLNIDGIIGSNLMRFCHWTIDYQNAEIILFKDTVHKLPENVIHLPFVLNKQYDQIVSLKFGKATLKNLKIDSGSNGSLTLSKNAMNVLKENEIITETFAEKGFTSSGLYGKASASTREFAWADTLQNNNFIVEGVELKTGKSGLIGGEILSRFVVTLNFKEKEISFVPVDNSTPDYSTFGFSLGYSDEEEFYIQAIKENSPAEDANLIPGLKVLRFNELDFTNGSSFCDYVWHTMGNRETLKLEYIDKTGQTKTKILQKRFIY